MIFENDPFGVPSNRDSSVKVAVVSYTNSLPFNRALKRLSKEKFKIENKTPRACFQSFQAGEVDMALVPTGSLLSLSNYKLIEPYCIGADKHIRTVSLLSNSPLEKIKKVYLDSHSLTSINLFKVLNRRKFKLSGLEYEHCTDTFDFHNLQEGEAAVAIGDKVFELENEFSLNIDLAEAWHELTGYGFVFACWVANPRLDMLKLAKFNHAIGQELKNLPTIDFKKSEVVHEYIKSTVKYQMDPKLKKGMQEYLNELKTHKSEHFFLS